MKKIYLDYAATTPIDKKVLEEMFKYSKSIFGNPSSLYASGREAKKIIEETREKIVDLIGGEKDEVIFTSGGTESDNLAILGVARANSRFGKHIVVSAIEHKAVLESVKVLEKEGFRVSYAPVDEFGIVDVEKLFSLIESDTILVSIMMVNNELGTIQPIPTITKRLSVIKNKNNFPLFHTDACQAVGKVEVDVKKLGVDLLTFNGSKIYGPKGIGVLYKKSGVQLSPLVVGGGQEYGLRGGTESVPLIVALGKALELVLKSMEKENERLRKLQTFFVSSLKKNIPGLFVSGHPKNVVPNIVHVSVPGVEGESMLLMLDQKGIEVATGSACSAKDLHPSHVLVAIGQDENIIHGSIRFSFGKSTTKKDLMSSVKEFKKIVKHLRDLSPIISPTLDTFPLQSLPQRDPTPASIKYSSVGLHKI